MESASRGTGLRLVWYGAPSSSLTIRSCKLVNCGGRCLGLRSCWPLGAFCDHFWPLSLRAPFLTVGILVPALVEYLFSPSHRKLLKGQELGLAALAFGRGPGKFEMLCKYIIDDSINRWEGELVNEQTAYLKGLLGTLKELLIRRCLCAWGDGNKSHDDNIYDLSICLFIIHFVS